MEHPVGTGPFRLAEWRRSSRIVLERNPSYREEFYDEERAGRRRRARRRSRRALKGRRLPMVDRVEVAIIEEHAAALAGVPERASTTSSSSCRTSSPTIAMPEQQARAATWPSAASSVVRYPRADVTMSYFNMEHPVVGGYTPDKVALRRAIALAVDVERRDPRSCGAARRFRRSRRSRRSTAGYDPAFRPR